MSVVEGAELPIEPITPKLRGPAVDAENARRFEAALLEILKIAETSTIPDRHGEWSSACDTTCLNDIRRVVKRVLGR